MYVYCMQMLEVETMGKVIGFEAVAGCGLKCQVKNVEDLINSGISDIDLMNKRNSQMSFQVSIDGVTADSGQLDILQSDIIGTSMLE